MPLEFQSKNRGPIAFGFFNIDTDMLLLEHYFLFASEFCQYISDLAQNAKTDSYNVFWEIDYIEDHREVGDLMGAIHGIRHVGFIGAVYTQFPFPGKPEEFKQKPEGFQNRIILEGIIGKYARKITIPFKAEFMAMTITIGDYVFTSASFLELINYVWVGGYPKWRNNVRPDYVLDMRNKIEGSKCWVFEGVGGFIEWGFPASDEKRS